MRNSGNSINVIFKALDEVTAPVKRIQNQVGVFTTKLNATNAAMAVYAKKAKASFAGFAGIGGYLTGIFATGSIIAFANKSIDEFNKSAQAIKNVEAGLISTKNAANKTIPELKKMAETLQSTTFFEDDSILNNVTAQMLTFTNITGKTFDRAQKAVLDITAKLYGVEASEESLKGVTLQLSKALNMPATGMNALARSGIQFSAKQKAVIKNLVATNRLGEAQTLMLKEIESQYGGTAKALAETSFGKQKQMMNEIGNRMESIGEKVAPLKLKILDLFEKILDKLPPILNWLEKHKTLIINITGALVAYKAAQLAATLAVLAFSKASAVSSIIQYLSAVISLTKGVRSLAQAQALLNLLLTSNPVGLIITAIGLLAAGVFLVVKNWKPIKTFFANLWSAISKGFKAAYETISNSINGLPLFIQGFVRMFFDILTFPVLIVKHWSKIKDFFANLWDGIKKIFRTAIDGLVNIFPDWLKNLIGVKNIAVSVQEKTAKNVSKPVVQSALKQMSPLSIFSRGFGTNFGSANSQKNIASSANLPKAKFVPEMKATGKNLETVNSVKNNVETNEKNIRNVESVSNFETTKNSIMKQESELIVRFENAPKGTRVDTKKTKKGINWSMGYSGAF